MLQQEFVRYEKPIDILIGLEPDQVSLHPWDTTHLLL